MFILLFYSKQQRYFGINLRSGILRGNHLIFHGNAPTGDFGNEYVHKYNGKEMYGQFGLHWMGYGARF